MKTALLGILLVVICAAIFYRVETSIQPDVVRSASPTELRFEFIAWEKIDNGEINVLDPFGMNSNRFFIKRQVVPEKSEAIRDSKKGAPLSNFNGEENELEEVILMRDYKEEYLLGYQGYITTKEFDQIGILKVRNVRYPVKFNDTILDMFVVREITGESIKLKEIVSGTSILVDLELKSNDEND